MSRPASSSSAPAAFLLRFDFAVPTPYVRPLTCAGLRRICDARDSGRVVLALKEIVPDYTPSAPLLSRFQAPERSLLR